MCDMKHSQSVGINQYSVAWILNIQLRWVDKFLLSISETDRVLACVWTIGSNSMRREWKVDLRLCVCGSEWLLWRAVTSPQLTLCFLLTWARRGFHAGNIFLTLTPECLTFVRLNSSFVCLCNYAPYDCTDKITTIKLSLSPCAHMVRAPQSKDCLQSNWHMEKLNLCKWPLGAVLSVLEGLQGHCTHTLRHKYKLRKGCVSWRDCGVVTLLMGPYGHKTNTNCFSSLLVIRSWRCRSHSEEMVTGHVDCELTGTRVNNLQVSCPQQPACWDVGNITWRRDHMVLWLQVWFRSFHKEFSCVFSYIVTMFWCQHWLCTTSPVQQTDYSSAPNPYCTLMLIRQFTTLPVNTGKVTAHTQAEAVSLPVTVCSVMWWRCWLHIGSVFILALIYSLW